MVPTCLRVPYPFSFRLACPRYWYDIHSYESDVRQHESPQERLLCCTYKYEISNKKKRNHTRGKHGTVGVVGASDSLERCCWCILGPRSAAPYMQGITSLCLHITNLDACPLRSFSKLCQRAGCPLLQAVLFGAHTQVRHQRRTAVDRSIVLVGVTPYLVWHCFGGSCQRERQYSS